MHLSFRKPLTKLQRMRSVTLLFRSFSVLSLIVIDHCHVRNSSTNTSCNEQRENHAADPKKKKREAPNLKKHSILKAVVMITFLSKSSEAPIKKTAMTMVMISSSMVHLSKVTNQKEMLKRR